MLTHHGPPDAGELFRLWDAPKAGAPVFRAAGHVVVTGHDLVRDVLTDAETFAPDNALDAVTTMPVSVMRVLAGHGFRLPPTLANNGTRSHPGIRAIVADALHPTRVAEQRPWLVGVLRRRIATAVVRLRAGGEVDLNELFSVDLPLLVLARLIALPDDDVAEVKKFSRSALELFWAPVSVDRQHELAELVGRHHAGLRRFVRVAPGMIGRLREHAAEHGLGEDEVIGALFFLLVAGQETTSQFLTLLLHRLIGEPHVLAGLADGSVSAAAVVEEGLRLEPPIVSWRRVAARDADLGGTRVRRGESVLLWLAAAGRDPAMVADTDDYCPAQRGSRRHLAFGAGAHRCLGAQLARMESEAVVTETAPLLRRIADNGRVVRAPWCPDNLSFRMPDALVVALGR